MDRDPKLEAKVKTGCGVPKAPFSAETYAVRNVPVDYGIRLRGPVTFLSISVRADTCNWKTTPS